MDKKELFTTPGNLIFVSKSNGVIGSLYFHAIEDEDENKKVYRGRIRLCHEHGPSISFSNKPEDEWLLVNYTVYIKYKDHKKDLTKIREDIKNTKEVIYGDLVTDKEGTIDAAKGKQIYELYSHSHPSRGVLSVESINKITIENINEIMKAIEKFKDKDSTDEKITTKKSICAANKAIIDLIKNSKMPFLNQKPGVYGC